MERRRSPHDSPLTYRRKNRAAYPNSLPGSRSSSPGRNVMLKRAMFENNTSTNQTSNKKGYNEFSSFGDEPDEITIEGVEEFDRVYNSSLKNSLQSNSHHESSVKTSTEYSGGKATDVTNATNNGKNISATSENIDRNNARIIPDYVSAVSKSFAEHGHSTEAIANENVDRRRMVKRRGEGSRARRYQTLQDQSTEIQAAKQRYLPTYIQPVSSSNSIKGHGVSETDVYSQPKRDALLNNRRNISAPNEQKTRHQVQHLESWKLRTRLPSSGDSSNSEMPTSIENQKTTNYIEAKQIDPFDHNSDKQAARTARRHRLRNNNTRQTTGTVLDQHRLTSPSKQQTALDIHSHNLRMDRAHGPWFDEQPGTGQILLNSTGQTSSHSGRRGRVRRRVRSPIVAETEDKYSTIPADFRPGEMTNAIISAEQQLEDTSLQAASSDSNCNQARSSSRNELMITNEQTLVSLEDAKKKSSDVKGDIANHSIHIQRLQTNHSPDKTRFATSHKGPTDKSFVVLAPNRSKQVDNLKNLFSSVQPGKIEFGRAYTKEKQKFHNHDISRHEAIKREDDHVSYSQPLLKVTKIAEDFWPRDEATEKLLMRNHSNNSDMQKNDSSSVKSNEMSRMPERIDINQADKSHASIDTTELLRSPKETNLSDPVDFDDANFNELPNSSNAKTLELNVVPIQNHRTQNVSTKRLNKLSSDKWSYDDPDSKLEAFDSNYNSSGGDLSKTQPGSDPHEFNYKDPNALVNSTWSNESHLQSNNSLFSPVATSERKSSVVSQSTALPRYITSTENKNSVESLVDEGCCVDDGSTTELSNFGSSASFSAYPNLDRNENRVTTSGKRRRKGPASTGQHGSDTSNNSSESNRSLSDPLANRKKSPNSAEDETGAIDSNFQYPLKSKEYKESHHPEKTATKTDESECSDTGSMQSDSTDKVLVQAKTIEPSSVEELVQSKSMKTLKKKSFSDPDSKAVLTAGLMNKSDLDLTPLHNSSSDPNLADKIDAQSLGRRHHQSRSSVTSDRRSKDSSVSHIADITQSIEQLSQSLAYEQDLDRSNNKIFHPQEKNHLDQTNIHSDNDSFFKPIREGETDFSTSKNEPHPTIADNPIEHEEEQFNEICKMMTKSDISNAKAAVAHGRSCSEPVGAETLDTNLARRLYERGRRPGIVQAPSLTDVLHGDGSPPKPLSNSIERKPSATLPRTTTPRGLDYHTYHKGRPSLELRRHVVDNLLDTEGSYVNCLRNLNECYLEPLKRPGSNMLEARLVDEIFYKIPELLQHHQRFYAKVQSFCVDWDSNCKIGEFFLESFKEDNLLEFYTSYVNNFRNSKKAIATACETKVAFKLFLEQCQRENKEKQSLSDLMIQPVQRIPRYRLIIKDLLKYTPDDHPDSKSLLLAEKEIDLLAAQINQGEKAANRTSRLIQDIEQAVEGYVDTGGNSKRKFLHQYFCVDVKSANKKDRSLWLFNDILMCTTYKKVRPQTLRRSSNLNLPSITQDHPSFDVFSKYKFIWKYPLEEISLKGGLGPQQKIENERQIHFLKTDLEFFDEIEEIAERLNCDHVDLDELIERYQSSINQKLLEKQQPLYQSITSPGRSELIVSTASEGSKNFQFDFVTDNLKADFEQQLWDASHSLTGSAQSEAGKNSREPAFLKSIAIIKTRNGMQFSCAASNIKTSPDTKEVWVCNTDGYVGQICFLTLDPDLNQTRCITVCHAKICCIAQVPPWDRKLVPVNLMLNDISRDPIDVRAQRRSSSNSNLAKQIISFDEDTSDETDEDNTSPISTVNTTSPYSTLNNTSPYSTLNSTSTLQYDEEVILPIMSPFLTSSIRKRFLFATNCHTQSYPVLPVRKDYENDTQSQDTASIMSRLSQKSFIPSVTGGGGGAYKKDGDGVTRYGSLGDLLSDENNEQNRDVISGSKALGNQGSMWLGTEDGKIYIYSTSEATGASKNIIPLHHNSSVQCILNHQDQVFVAFGNGDLKCYSRDHKNESQWDFTNKKCLQGFSSNNPISKMLVVNERELWCGCQNQIRILDIKTHNVKSFFSVSSDNKRQIYCMASCGFGVWVALDKKPQARLYHSITHEQIADVDVSHPVTKMLASSDPIIRQHKAACLRITALLVCKNLLWVGTSAGVVITLALPNITESTTPSALPVWIQPRGLSFGHTGHVRFLTAVEIPDKDSTSSRSGRRSSKRRLSAASTSSQTRSTTLVISGGDGYENFKNSTSEAAGKDDSTNHLLIWKIP